MQAGLVNGRIILVNASAGLYPKLLEERELHSRKYGPSRWGALVAALRRRLREWRHLRLRIESDGTLRQVRTPPIFIANNPLQLQQLGLPAVQMLACGRLAAVVPRRTGRSATGRRMKVAIDGELVQLLSPLEFCVSVRPLFLLGPQRAIAESAAGASVEA